MSETKDLLVEVHEGIAVLTMNRPEVHNAISMSMRKMIGETLDAFNEDDDVRVLILTGAGSLSVPAWISRSARACRRRRCGSCASAALSIR